MGKGLNLAKIDWEDLFSQIGAILEMINWEAIGAALTKIVAAVNKVSE